MISSNHFTLEAIANFLTKLAEKSESVYWLSSPDFKRIVYVSPAYEKIWGRSRDILYVKPELWITHLHPDDVGDYNPIHAMADRINELGPAARYEENYRIVRPDGEVRWIFDRGFPIFDETNRCCGVTGVAIDVTREKQSEEVLRKAKEEYFNQLKTQFVRNMEHDVRTPFNGIWGLSSYLWERETDAEKKELLSDITHSAKELLDYCNDILDFSRIELGNLPVLEKKINVKQLISSIMMMEVPAAKIKKINLTVNYSDSIPTILLGDPHRLQSTLINLVSNAIKFTKKGSVELAIELAKQPENRQIILKFIVKDTGIGIPAEMQDFIYEKFTRLNASNRGNYKGAGLGLRIVKQFVEEMNGEIELQSELGVGSTFICMIPFKLPLIPDENKRDNK